MANQAFASKVPFSANLDDLDAQEIHANQIKCGHES